MLKEFVKFLTTEELLECNKYLKQWEYMGTTSGGEEEVTLWCIRLNSIKFFTEYLFNKIKSATGDNLTLDRVYANGQTYGIPGKMHMDSDDPNSRTFLMYTNPVWKQDWGGGTAFSTEDVDMVYPYIPSNAIYFNGDMWHCGLEPTRYCKELRTTIAFKMMKV